MPEPKPQLTQQQLEEVEHKVEELKQEVEVAKQANAPAQPVGKVKQQAAELTTNTTRSPRKMLSIILIVGVGVLLLGIVALIVTSGVLWGLLIILVIIAVLLSDKLR